MLKYGIIGAANEWLITRLRGAVKLKHIFSFPPNSNQIEASLGLAGNRINHLILAASNLLHLLLLRLLPIVA